MAGRTGGKGKTIDGEGTGSKGRTIGRKETVDKKTLAAEGKCRQGKNVNKEIDGGEEGWNAPTSLDE